ncbi:HNH endonuclease [Aeromonas veronii]
MTNKLARICWNTKKWAKPTGANGKSKGESFEKEYSYGFEEWLNGDDFLIDGYKYGYLQGVGRGEKIYPGQTFNFFLYTKSNGSTLCVGIIYNAYCLTNHEISKAITDHQENGFIRNVIKELNDIGITKIYESKNEKNQFTFNIKYHPCDFVLFKNPIQANEISHKRYTLTDIPDETLQKVNKTIEIELATAYAEDDIDIKRIIDSTIDVTEKVQIINSRRGQGIFRSRVESIEPSCRVTRLSNKALLIASHIKPWCECDNIERLDGNNGLLLSPHIDKLFDQGWITFTDAGDLLCAEPSIERALQQWGVELPINVGPFKPKQSEYLAYHRSEVYRSAPTSE